MSNRRLKQLYAVIRDETELLMRLGETETRCEQIIRSRHADLIDEVREALVIEPSGMPQQAFTVPDGADLAVSVPQDPSEQLVFVHIRVDEEKVVKVRMTAEETEGFANALLRAARFVAGRSS